MASSPRVVSITTATITLDAFLKWAGVAPTGGQAKRWIQEGQVRVNGIVDRRRGRTLKPGDRVLLPDGVELLVATGAA